MSEQVLRDSHNNLIGKIKTLPNGKQEAWDAHNRQLGSYDPKTDQTRNVHNQVVGKGNLLASLFTT